MPTIICITIFLIMYFLLKDDSENIKYDTEEYIRCNKCVQKVNMSYDFCPHCKENIKEECPYCKKIININWRYCPYCGTTKENR